MRLAAAVLDKKMLCALDIYLDGFFDSIYW